MSNARLYGFWGDLTEALRTGSPQNEIKHTGKPVFDELYSDPDRLEQFMHAMSGTRSTSAAVTSPAGARAVGFREIEVVPLAGPASAGIAYK